MKIEYEDFSIYTGEKRVMFSAPHAVEQTREGKIKFAEQTTGIIVEKLSQLGYHGIIKTLNNGDDANYDEVSPYKDYLKDYVEKNRIKILFDLHELSPNRQMDICIGTGWGKNIYQHTELVEIVQEEFESADIRDISIDIPFAASFKYTVSSFISRKCKIPVFQIEMNCAMFFDNDEAVERVMKVLDAIAEKCEELL